MECRRQAAVPFEVLGPMRASRDGAALSLPAGRQRWLLAVLPQHEGDERWSNPVGLASHEPQTAPGGTLDLAKVRQD